MDRHSLDLARGGYGGQRPQVASDGPAFRQPVPPGGLRWSCLQVFTSGCEGKLGVALESLQGLRDLT